MDRTLLILDFTILLITLQVFGLFLKWKYGKNLLYLISICSIFWGTIWYFYYGFPLDEGTCPEKEIPVYERGFHAAFILLVICGITLILSFFRKKRF